MLLNCLPNTTSTFGMAAMIFSLHQYSRSFSRNEGTCRVRYQQSRVFSGHDVRFVFCVCFHVKNYVWYKSLHKNNVTIEAHWLHTFPLHLSFVLSPLFASRLRPPLSTTPRTVAPAHQTRRDGLLHQTGYKAKGLLRCLECVQQRGPRRGYGALLPSRRRRLRSREDCHRKKGKATPFVLCTIISVFRVRVERSISSCGRTIRRKTPPGFWRRI